LGSATLAFRNLGFFSSLVSDLRVLAILPMSYTVVILLQPVPEDDVAAWKFLRELAERSPAGEVPPTFHRLIDQLTARYPCICDLPGDHVDGAAWSDGPLRNNAGHAMTVLGLALDRVEEVQPWVVEIAKKLGLVVFDEQVGRIYRPGKPAED
jgi:hypothetical protein